MGIFSGLTGLNGKVLKFPQQTLAEDTNEAAALRQNAGALQETLIPGLEDEWRNPQGMTPEEMALSRTSSRQATAGALAGAEGEAQLAAARRRNPGGYTSSLRDIAREKMKADTGAETNLTLANEDLKRQQKTQGLTGLTGLYNTDLSGMLHSMGLENQSVSNYTNAFNADQAARMGWLNMGLGVLKSLPIPGMPK